MREMREREKERDTKKERERKMISEKERLLKESVKKQPI